LPEGGCDRRTTIFGFARKTREEVYPGKQRLFANGDHWEREFSGMLARDARYL
jgi:hypothetical protein